VGIGVSFPIGFYGSFPAKMTDYSVFAVAYTETVSDAVKATDYMCKGVGKPVQDVSKVTEYFSRTISIIRIIQEVVRGVDLFAKDAVKINRDTFKGTDYFSKGFGKTVLDIVKGRDFFSKGVGKSVFDVFKATDYVSKLVSKIVWDSLRGLDFVRKALIKCLADFAVVRDFFSKGVGKSVRDYGVGEFLITIPKLKIFQETVRVLDFARKDMAKKFTEVVSVRERLTRHIVVTCVDKFLDLGGIMKGVVRSVVDKVTSVDVLTKVAYKLAGKDVRRVYWHKVWQDIILPSDHNVKVDVAKILLEIMKRVRDKLG
jgi:hypothetical protein